MPKNVSQLIETSSSNWKPSKVPGVEYISLHADPDERMGSFLLRMAPNTTYPKHRHPAGEEILVLKGDMVVGDRKMKGGDFLYSPPGSIHTASTTGGCMFLSILPKPIDIISQSKDEGEVDKDIAQETSAAPPAGRFSFGEVEIENLPEPTPDPNSQTEE